MSSETIMVDLMELFCSLNQFRIVGLSTQLVNISHSRQEATESTLSASAVPVGNTAARANLPAWSAAGWQLLLG